jgi:hypothetical protein
VCGETIPKELAIGSVSQGNKLKSGARFVEPEGNGDSKDFLFFADAILDTEARTARSGVSMGNGSGGCHTGILAGFSGTVKGFISSEIRFANRTVTQTAVIVRMIVRMFRFISGNIAWNV